MHTSFSNVDQLLVYIQSLVSADNRDINRVLIGYAAVSCVTVFEVEIKNSLISFASDQSPFFKNYVEAKFSRLNGQISIDKIKEYLKDFDSKLSIIFTSQLEKEKNKFLRDLKRDVTESYKNLLTGRHKFVHSGNLTLSINEVANGFEDGKQIIKLLQTTLSNAVPVTRNTANS